MAFASMTDKELKKLNRAELLELLIAQMKENKSLKDELQSAKAALEDRDIAIDKAGSIAEASLQINGVFRAAEAAAAQYLDNIRSLNARQEAVCRKREAECAAACDAMRAKAEEDCRRKRQSADEYWELMTQRLGGFYDEHYGLRELMTKVEDRNDEETQP